MKKIQIYVENIKYNEADKQVILLSNSLSAYFDITIISSGNIENEIVLNKKIKLFELNMSDTSSYFNNIKLKNSVSKFIKNNNSDIIISTSLNINKVLSQLNLDMNLIYWRLDTNIISVENYKKYFKGFSKVVFMSDEEKNSYNFIDIEKIVIPPAIGSVPLDFEYSDSKNIVYMGSLDSKELIDKLLDIMILLKLKDDDIKLNIIGDGSYRLELMNSCKVNNIQNNCIFHGDLDENEIDYEFKRMALFLNLNDGISNKIDLIEAMNYGIPPISYYSEALKNIIENDINGYLIKENDPKYFVNKILLVFSSKETLTNMRLCARETSMFYEINSIKGEWLKIL